MQDNNAGDMYDDGFSALFVDAVAIARNILAVRRPIIAAVNGDAIGLGATIALFSDIVYMADGARIGDPHAQAGLVAADGGVVLWPLLLGINRAKEYLLTGDLLPGARRRAHRAREPLGARRGADGRGDEGGAQAGQGRVRSPSASTSSS